MSVLFAILRRHSISARLASSGTSSAKKFYTCQLGQAAMRDDETLLSFIAHHVTKGLEDVATHSLFFILSRSMSARRALSEFLGDDCGTLHVATVQPWQADEHGAIPDLACLDESENLVALIESKFWAQLTHHQPVTYWQGLPVDKPSVLLFLAPAIRVDQGSLWDDLVDRLRGKCHELGPVRSDGHLITALSKVDQRRLMLTSWELLLERLAGSAKEDGDARASFEIAELQGLAASVIAGDRPTRAENLQQLIADAVVRLEQLGWANTDRLTAGEGYNYYARYLYPAGAYAALRIDYDLLRQNPNKPLWVWFLRDSNASVGVNAVGDELYRSNEPESDSRSREILLPIALPEAADRQTTLDAIVSELERIARIIDPCGPTYSQVH